MRGTASPPPLSRRQFLAGTAALAAAGMQSVQAGLPDGTVPRFLAARRNGTRYEAALIDARAQAVGVLELPDRGHSFAVDQTRQRAVVFGRQPGFFALAFPLDAPNRAEPLPLPEGRHFFGHGVFSADGTRLFATENDFERGRGVLGVYDARAGANWRRLGEFDTGGIGPHEVVLMPDRQTLCVANGGLLTHPDSGKTPLNLATMRPSLAYLQVDDGRIDELVSLPPELFQLSIRHVAVDASGAVWFACQHEGPATQTPPLLGRHRRGRTAELFAGPAPVLRTLRNYLGSIAFDSERGVIATSSPVGGSVAFWNVADGRSLGAINQADACGLAALPDGRFLISNGFGAVISAVPGGRSHELLAASSDIAWDNHLRRT